VPKLTLKKSLIFLELTILKMFQSEKISPLCKNPASLSSGLGWPHFPATVNVAAL